MNAEKLREAYNTGTRWDMIDECQRMVELRHTYTNAVLMRGQSRIDAGTLDIICKNLNEFIKDEFPSIRDKEIGYILNLGISGELGQDTYVNGANFMKWMRTYYRNAERLAAVDAEEEERQAENKITRRERAQRNIEAFNNAVHRGFDFYKTHGTIFGEDYDEKGNRIAYGFNLPQWAAQVYQYYRALGKIPPPTKEQLAVAVERANATMVKNGNYSWKYPAEVLKITAADWRDSYLLEAFYEDVIEGRITK